MKQQTMKSSARLKPSKGRQQLWVSGVTTAFLFFRIACVVSEPPDSVHVLILDNTTNNSNQDINLSTYKRTCNVSDKELNSARNYQRCMIIISEKNSSGSQMPENCMLNASLLDVKKMDSSFVVTLNSTALPKNFELRIAEGWNSPCRPSQLMNNDNQNISCNNVETIFNLTVKDLCGNQSKYSEKSCQGWPPERFILTMTLLGESSCVTCKNPFSKPETTIPAPQLPATPSGVIDAEKASEVMNNLSLLVDKMGNATVVAVTMGSVTGVLTKIQKGKESNVIFGFSPGSDISVSEKDDSVDAITRSVKVPQEASIQAIDKNGSFIGMFRFPSMSQDSKGSLVMNNEVTSIKMGADISNLTNPIELEYRKVNTAGDITCVSWNGKGNEPNWTADGCGTVKANDTITCKCTHLSFFAILLSTPTGNLSASDVSSLTYITNIGCGLSMFFLAIGLFMQCLLSQTKSSQATLFLVNLFVALFLLNLSFLVNESVANLSVSWVCVGMAAIMHYTMLTTFTWFLLQAVHLYLQLWRANHIIQHYMMKMYVAGWVPSALVVVVLAIMNKYTTLIINTTNGDVKMCWITDHTVHYVVNIGYYVIVFVLTLVVFIVMVRQIMFLRKKNVKGANGGSTTTPSSTLSILGLLFLLGITWGFAFFSYGVLAVPSYYIFSIFNSFQGFFLFIYYYKTRRFGTETRHSTPSTNSSISTSGVTMASNIYDNNSPSKSQMNSCDNPYAFKTK